MLGSDAKTKQNQKNDWTASKTKNALVHFQKRKRYRESRCTLCTSLAMTPLSPYEQLLFFFSCGETELRMVSSVLESSMG